MFGDVRQVVELLNMQVTQAPAGCRESILHLGLAMRQGFP
jgi:hypothetical protein